MARKATGKPAEKTSAKKPTPKSKKPTAKKASAKKAETKRASVKQTTGRKTSARKPAAKKALAKKKSAKEPKVTLALASKHGLSKAELALAKDRLGRTPTYTELGVLSVLWSEHGCRKSSRSHLAKLPRSGPMVLNMRTGHGVVDIGEDWAAVLTINAENQLESGPPTQAGALGVRAGVAEVIAAGAVPVANCTSLRFGESSHHRTRQLASAFVDGIGEYGNRVGVPTIGGEISFDDCFDDASICNVMTIGVCRHDEVPERRSAGAGDLVIYVGAKTRRNPEPPGTTDSEEGEQDDSSTHVSDPLLVRGLCEALGALVRKDLVRDIIANGDAGLALGGVAAVRQAEVGIALDVDQVPCADEAMTAYEVLLSGSPDRALLVVEEGREADVQASFEEQDLECAVVGRVTDTGSFEARWGGEVVCQLPMGLLTAAAPKYDRETQRPAYFDGFLPVELDDLPTDLASEILDLVGSVNTCSRSAVLEHCDAVENVETVLQPGLGAATIRIPTSNRVLSISVDCNSRYCFLNPRLGAQHAVAECARNISVMGATPLAAVAGLNVGDPEEPEVMWQFVEAVEGLAHGLEMMETPAVVATADFGAKTDGQAIYPTPVVGMLGVFRRLPRRGRFLGPGFSNAGDRIILFGETFQELDGSEWAHVNGFLGAAPPRLDWQRELAVQALVRDLVIRGWVNSAHDLSDGGLAVALAEAAYFSTGGALGAELSFEPQLASAAWLFSESASRALVSVPLDMIDPVLEEAVRMGVTAAVIGTVCSNTFTWVGHFNLSLDELRERYQHGLDGII